MDRAQWRGRGVNRSRDGAGTAQTPASGRAVCAVPASAGRLGVEGTTGRVNAPPRLPCRMGNRVLLWTGRRCRPHLCALWCVWMSSGRRHPKTWRVAPPETRHRPGLPRQETAFVSVSCVRARQTLHFCTIRDAMWPRLLTRACAKSTSRPDLSKARTNGHHEAPGPSYALRECAWLGAAAAA